MHRYEYKVVPAPRTPARARGVKGDEARFARTIEEAINAVATDGWDYVRSDTLPCERRGWFSSKILDQTVLIFRRSKTASDGTAPTHSAFRHAPEPTLTATRRPAPAEQEAE